MKAFTVSEYARMMGVSRTAIYKQLETRLKPFVVDQDGKKVLQFPDGVNPVNPFNPVNVDNGETVNLSTRPEVDELTDQVDSQVNRLTEQLQEREEDLRRIREDYAEAAEKNDQLQETVNQLTDQVNRLTADRQAEVDRLTGEVNRLTGEVNKMTADHKAEVDNLTEQHRIEVEGYNQRIQDKDAHISTLTETLERVRADLEAEKAAHAADRERDAKALDQAQQLQAQANALLHQEQTKHKPFRLLLAEKAASLANVFRKTDTKNKGDQPDPEQ